MKANAGSARKPRLLVVNQYYWPGVEATAHLLTELCESLAGEYEIRVLTGVPRGHDGIVRRELRKGVEIVRVLSTSFDRAHLGLRALNYVSYIGSSLLAGLVGPRPDLVLCMTDPPMVGDVGLAVSRRFRVPLLVISEDVFPEIATTLGRLKNPLLVATLREMVGLYLKRADRLVAIGDTMRARLEEKGARADRIRVIPNWVDTEAITPQPRDNPWSRLNRLTNRFVVMHSGNIGHAQNLETLIRATTFLRDLDRLSVIIIGAGARYDELVHLAERLAADKLRSLPYQAREVLSMSLSTADLHFVGLAEGLAGYVVPSRLYGIMAAGRPVVVAPEAASETAQVVERVGCGIVIPPSRPELLAEVLRDAYEGRYDLEAMGARGRAYVVEDADTRVALGRYRELLRAAWRRQPDAQDLLGKLAALRGTLATCWRRRRRPARWRNVRRADILPSVW
jgi:glycosyltransferase involved in cell wall biosynthesis